MDGFSREEAVTAVDARGADWKEQAAEEVESYLSIMDMTRFRLLDQLCLEGFSYDEAVYGVDAAEQ